MKLTNLGDVVSSWGRNFHPAYNGLDKTRAHITRFTPRLLQPCSDHVNTRWPGLAKALRTRFACTDVSKGWFPQIFWQPNGHSLSTPDRREYHVRYTLQCLKWTWTSRLGIWRVNYFILFWILRIQRFILYFVSTHVT